MGLNNDQIALYDRITTKQKFSYIQDALVDLKKRTDLKGVKEIRDIELALLKIEQEMEKMDNE